MSPEATGDAGYVPRLLAAAAFVTQRATEDSLSQLRLTQERTVILGILASLCADEAALSAASGLDPDCVHDCVLALECCGYATSTSAGMWTITAAGVRIQAQAEQTGARLSAGANDDAMRRELSTLIRALAPPPRGANDA